MVKFATISPKPLMELAGYIGEDFWRGQIQIKDIMGMNSLYSLLCLFVLRFYDQVNPMRSCRARSVNLNYWADLVL